MNRFISLKAIIYLLLTSSFLAQKSNIPEVLQADYEVKLDILNMFDSSRNRIVPVAFYLPKTKSKIVNQRVVIFSHVYRQNKGGSNLSYSYLTEKLASKGYFVISIQHELATDSLMPTAGNPKIVRRPFWNRGADNIFFVINKLRKSNPTLDFSHITLIGHSNGADISALFPQKYPNLVYKIITLDNRRMALPKTKALKVYSLRSCDQQADEGVLPMTKEMKKFKITIIKLPKTKHNDMDDNGNSEQRKEITDYVLEFLRH